MGGLLLSRSLQMLDNVPEDHEFKEAVEFTVKELVSALEKIEKLLNKYSDSRKVMENMGEIRTMAYSIEFILEIWAVYMELSLMPEKKRGILGFLRRCLGWKYDGGGNFMWDAILVIMEKSDFTLESTKWLHDTFPEDVLESEHGVVLEANHRSLRWPRHMYAHGVEEHFVERKDELNKLISLVEDKEHQVVSIWGVKGLGKTTLARKVYIHPKVRSRFNSFAWVSLDQDYEGIGSLLKNILNQLGAGTVKKSAEEQKKSAQDQRNRLQDMKNRGVGAVKKGVEEKKKEVEEEREIGVEGKKKKLAEFLREDAGEKKKGTEVEKEGVQEHEKGTDKKNEGRDKKKGVVKEVAGVSIVDRLRAALFKKSIGEHKQGEEEKGEDAEEKNNGAEEQQKSSEEEMLAQLKEILRGKSCLVVIDGISELSQWTEISSSLVMKDTDTKCLLTTDDETTARVGHCHCLRLLKEDEGWELLKKYAFHGKTVPDLGLVPKLGKEMVGKCGYLPSKIASLGRTLSAMSSSDWHKVNDDFTAYLETDDQSTSNERLWDDVDPNYSHLSYSQKQRFLYLAIFKEDKDIDPEDLLFLWMGEGMVQHEEDKEGTIMDTAQCYLQELAHEGLLNMKVDELSGHRRFLPLSLRNCAWQLSLYLAEKEYLRLSVVDVSGGKQPSLDRYSWCDAPRRMVIHFDKISAPEELILKLPGEIRSLLFLNSYWEYVSLPLMISDFQEFVLLRVLHFVRCKFEGRKLPEGIWKLLNLNYFGLLYCDLDELPESISNLKYLQVLNVRSYDDAIIAIPKSISQLTRLKHLRLPHNSDRKQYTEKLKFDGLDELETLVGFNADIHDIDSLSKLKKLRYLGVYANSNDSLESIIVFSKLVKSDGADIRINLWIDYKCDFTSSEGSAILEELLMCPNLDALTFSMVHIQNFPNCGKYASSDLTQIKLTGCELCGDPMEALGKFPNLRKLCLGYGAFVGKEMAVSDKGFSKLEYLEFRCLPNLEEWMMDKGALPNLSSLTVKQCPKLKSIPEELASVSSLKNVEMDDKHMKKYEKFAVVRSVNVSNLDPFAASSSSAL